MKLRLILGCMSVLVIFLLSISVTYAKVDPKTIVGIWLLDEGSGNTLKDSSGNKNDGKNVGAVWVKGKFGSALEFDGGNHAEIPASETTDKYVDGFTYLLWVMPTGAAPNANTRVIERDWHNPTIQMGSADFYGSIVIAGDQAASNVRGGAWTKGEWTFVALSWDGSTLRLYVNDKMVKDLKLKKPDFTKNNGGGAIWLASWKAVGWSYIGVIDDVGIFSDALSADDIKNIMTLGLDKSIISLSVAPGEEKLTSTWGQIKNQ
ncbi:MAG: LamG domain-containing protein [Candidatus Poribacteria bacterium]